MQRNIFRLLNIIFIETDTRRDSEIFSHSLVFIPQGAITATK